MKTAGLLLALLLTFFSCGKNEVVDGTTTVEGISQVSPINQNMADQLKEYSDFIRDDKFVKVNISYEFELFKIETETKVEDCFFDLLSCTQVDTNKLILGTERRQETLDSQNVTHALGSTRTEVINRMLDILAKAVSGYNYGYGRFVVAHSTGETYYFDLNLPLSANPTSKYNYSNNEGYSLTNSGGWYVIQ